MGNACPGGSRCEGGASGVGEKVQDFNGSSGSLDFLRKPVPVCRLLREKPGVFEAEGFQVKGKAFVMDAPLLGEGKEFPLAAAFLLRW